MDRLKKLNGSMIAAIVLSVLLIMSITTGATLAWFASRDSATNSLTMGEAVIVTIGEDYKQGDGTLAMNLPVDKTTNGLLPGMSVTPNIKVQLQKSNTNALLRARFITTVEYPDKYMDEAYSNTKKYADDTAVNSEPDTYEGRVLTNEATTVFKSSGGVKPEYTDGKITNYDKSGTEYVDAYGAKVYITSADLANGTDYSKVYKYNVFAGYMIYDYYNYLGQRYHNDMTSLVTEGESAVAVGVKSDPYSADNIAKTKAAHTKIIHLNRVEVRDEIANKINATDKKIAINGVEVEVTEKNAAELEIRQRCVDLTNAINRVLQGQRGYGIDPTTGKVVEDSTNGVKYTRRVADGWAYRDADQAWYYLGSQTNGFVIDNNSTGVNETVTTTQVAKDITKYSDVEAGNVTVRQPSYELLSSATNQYQSTVTTQGSGENAIKNDMTRNYLGGSSKDDSIDRVRNEIGVLNQETISSIDLSQGDVSIDFLTKRFVLPRFINNDYAKAKVTFTFTVEAVQDYLIDPLQEATAAADRIPNNLVNAILVFNNAFPQTLFPKSTDDNDLLRATGSTANVIPGGGESVKWNNSEDGSTTVTYRGVETQGDTFSYGYIDKDTLGGAAYTWTEGTETKTVAVNIKGYAVKIDEYGAHVADYKNAATYVRGTASSIGVGPYVTTTSPKTGA